MCIPYNYYIFIGNSKTKKNRKHNISTCFFCIQHHHPGRCAKCSTQQLAQTSATFASCLINSTWHVGSQWALKGTVVHFFPWKLTNSSPTKIHGWFRCFFPTEVLSHVSFWDVLGGVSHWKGTWENHRLQKCPSGEEMHSFARRVEIYADWDSMFRFFV